MNYISSLQTVLSNPANKDQSYLLIIARIIWWKCNQLFFKLPAVVSLTENVKLICHPETSFGSYVVYAKFPEYQEAMLVSSLLSAGDVFFDVGAHLGEYALIAASKVGKSGKVVAFEPTPKTIELLQQNVALNSMTEKIKVESKAVYSKNTNIYFSLEPESEVNHITASKSGKTIRVPAVTLDSYTKLNNISKISFLKLDVEGAEENILQGARLLLKRAAIECLMYEVNPKVDNAQEKLSNIITTLKKNKYSVFRIAAKGDYFKLKPVTNSLPEKTVNYLAVSSSSLKRVVSIAEKPNVKVKKS